MEGTPFGRYLLVELLGRGGMGEVWRAHDTATDRIVAVKVLPAQLARDDVFQQRFRREAHAAARLNDPHVVPIHGYGEIDGRLYVDMRLIEGRDLASLLRDGPLDPTRAVMIVEQVAKALNAAHRVGLVHRDVKPSNILVAEFDFAYLIDFGIARGVDEAGLTSTGGMIGTWHYMAPERLSSGDVDGRSDIYALACVLHECLTGTRPFPGESLERQVAAHLTVPPPRPSVARRGVPAQFDAVIAKGMAKHPDDRYATTLELANDARSAVTAPSSPSPDRAAPTVVDRPQPASRQDFETTPAPTWQPAPATVPAPQGAAVKPKRTGAKIGIGLAAAVLLASAITAAVLITNRGSPSDAGSTADTPRSTSVSVAPTDSTTAEPSPVPTSLTGTWSGAVSGDQSGFDVIADIVDGPPLTAVVKYPQQACDGTWTEKGSAVNGVRLLTETITHGSCVTSEVTLTPRSDGALDFRSTYYAASQQRNMTIQAVLRRMVS